MHNSIHDYKKMLRFMKKSLISFSKEASQITKPFIDNIDFLIVNFPYFKDINMVSDYFMTQNDEFNRVFTTKFHSFSNILFYDPKSEKSDLYDEVSSNKIKLWENVLGRSGRDKLKRSWVRSEYDENDTDIYTLNKKDKVLFLFFKIVNFHYKKIKKIIIDHINFKKVLEYLHIDDTLIRNILEVKHMNIFQGINNTSEYFINSGKYDLLELFYENEHDDEEEFLDVNRLVYLFLRDPNYLQYKTLYNILICKSIKTPIYKDFVLQRDKYRLNGSFICSDTKYYLYISLILKNDITTIDSDIISHISNLILKNKENAFLLCNIQKLGLTINDIYKLKLTIQDIDLAYKKGLSEKVKPKPSPDTLYSFCLSLLNKDKLSFIKYHEVDKINEYLDQCYDESLMRYICKLIIDEVPVLNIHTRH